jgi:translation initiation factor IF-2
VVAADDGVMPQTREAIDHVRAAGVPLIVALNKVDANNANPDRVKQQLMEVGLVPEEYGGDTIVVPTSALRGEGIDDLLENVLLVAELQELKANPTRSARGIVLEASTDPRRGVIATVLVQTGTLRVGDVIVAGLASGKIKAMTDEDGRRMQSAGPSTPVIVLGLNDVPPAGEQVHVAASETEARAEAEAKRRALGADAEGQAGVTLDSLFGEIHRGEVQDFNIVLKTDVQGSIEPLVRALEEIGNDEVDVQVIHASAGTVNESDVNLAAASRGVILAFNARPEPGARKLAEAEKVEIRQYSVIYDIVNDVQRAVEGMLQPIFEERRDALIEVREVFRRGRRNSIAGSYVREGTVHRDSLVRVVRKGETVRQSRIESLRRFQDDVREVTAGMECGIQVEGFNDFEQGDELICYHMEQVR